MTWVDWVLILFPVAVILEFGISLSRDLRAAAAEAMERPSVDLDASRTHTHHTLPIRYYGRAVVCRWHIDVDGDGGANWTLPDTKGVVIAPSPLSDLTGPKWVNGRDRTASGRVVVVPTISRIP
jgi:hypothetical protein